MQRVLNKVGPGLDWAWNGDNQLAVAIPDANKINQVHLIQPDGTEIRCLTCQQVSGGPPVGVHKGVPHFHPGGRFIVLQAEQANHPGSDVLAQPGSGRYNDIWATTLDGSHWWHLTDLSANPDGGTLFPVPSRDGTKLAWAERYAGPDNAPAALANVINHLPTKGVWGRWRLNVADFLIDGSGNPSLANTRRYFLGNGSFFEMQSWGSSNRLYFASDIGRQSPYVLDIWSLNLRSGATTQVTNTDNNWEEHISVSPSGRKLVLMSSACCSFDPGNLLTLAAEEYLANPGQSDMVQLTYFNTPGHSENTGQQSAAAKAVWSRDGRQLAIERIMLDSNPSSTDLWILTFAGACGAQ
jgi:Tol biopolymer transport system component